MFYVLIKKAEYLERYFRIFHHVWGVDGGYQCYICDIVPWQAALGKSFTNIKGAEEGTFYCYMPSLPQGNTLINMNYFFAATILAILFIFGKETTAMVSIVCRLLRIQEELIDNPGHPFNIPSSHLSLRHSQGQSSTLRQNYSLIPGAIKSPHRDGGPFSSVCVFSLKN